jgi:hypothetical protein
MERAVLDGKTLHLRLQLGLIYLKGDVLANGRVFVIIAVPPSSGAVRDEAAIASGAPSNGLQQIGDLRPYEVLGFTFGYPVVSPCHGPTQICGWVWICAMEIRTGCGLMSL